MSFLDYLKEHRGQFIDHRVAPPPRPGITAQDAEEALDLERRGSSPTSSSRDRRKRYRARGVRYRHVRPAFAPSPFSDPLPYEEPWERAFR